MKVVLDTNVLVSALMKPNGIEAWILLLALRGNLELYVSPAIFAEYERVPPARNSNSIPPKWKQFWRVSAKLAIS